MIYLKTMLTEIVTNPIIDLAKYLQLPLLQKAEELAYNLGGGQITFWLDELHPEINDEIEGFELEDIIQYLQEKYPRFYKEYIQHVADAIKRNKVDMNNLFPPGHPSWLFMEFKGYVKNQWLIHFSDFAKDIWRDQSFKYGIDDYTQLGLTTQYKDTAKRFGGYNFAYDVSDFARYGRSSYDSRGWKYGKEAVIFKASGVKVWHFGDEEPQVIFLGRTANDIVYIRHTSDGDWGISNERRGNYIFRGELPDVVRWIIANFNQYRNILSPS